ncbi:MAG TPA: PDZ domain-containing protein [Candidatus Avirikenella pullistercoris]|nr:PDZ domain-containing protein [Candidatus Avirikenella pullistercoris]
MQIFSNRHIFLFFVLLFISWTGIAGASDNKKDFDTGKNMEIFFNIFKNIDIAYVDPTNPDKLMQKAADAMLSSLDPYSEYLSEEDMADFEFTTTGKYGGVGALVRLAPEKDFIHISEVYKDCPADKAGFKPGDKIVAIDGENMGGKDVTFVSEKMKGTPGSTIQMTMRPIRGGEDYTVPVTRERITISAVSYYGFVTDSIGYISLDSFSENCSADVKKALTELKSQGPLKGVILDLRSNGGGLLSEAVDVAGLFVPKGTEIVSIKGRKESENETYKTHNDPFDTELPLLILVNSSSASSSEIVAGALQDLDRALIAGTRTFGKGLVQTTMGIGYGSFLKLTTAKYYIPSGRCIQALDYSHRNEDGSVGQIPDSLISEFTTRNGRKVYDGGGITPDVKIDPLYINKFTVSLIALGYIDDYAIKYYKEHTEAPDINNFSLSDEEYTDFGEFLKTKDMNFISPSESNLEKLRESAKKDKYYDEIKDELDRIETKIKGDHTRDLELYKDDIKAYLESAIVTAYHYAHGRSERAVNSDKDIKTAAELLSSGKYKEYLTVQ